MRILIAVLVVLVLIGGVAGIATQAYNAGVARGLAEGGRGPVPPGGAPYPYYGPYVYHAPLGFGFFGLLFPLLFVFLLFALFRGFFFRGHWGAHGPWSRGVPPAFDEWHRRAHESGGERGVSA